MESMLQQLMQSLEGYMPNLLGGLAILVIGWLAALVVAAVVRGVLRRTGIDARSPGQVPLSRSVSKGVFYVLIVLVLGAFFQALGLTMVVEPINGFLTRIFSFLPQLAGAGVLLLVAWIVGSVLRLVVRKALEAAKVDERLGQEGSGEVQLTQSLSEAVYWLVFLFFLPGILSTLQLDGLLEPVQGMLDKILGFLPNLVTAGVLMLVGWFVARLVQRIVTSLLAAAGADRLGQRVGLEAVLGQLTLSSLVGNVVYVFILIPITIAALNALRLDSITAPASAMLEQLLGAIPLIFAAAVVVGISYIIGKLLRGLVANLLAGIGFDRIPVVLGLGSGDGRIGEQTLSQLAGNLVMVVVMLFAAMEALELLGFAAIGELVMGFIGFAAHVVFGLVILAIGIYIANWVAGVVQATGVVQARFLSLLARVAILLLAGAMALGHMGVANEIITIAFGLLLGTVAVAAAVAFGLGGRDFAARQLEDWRRRLEGGEGE